MTEPRPTPSPAGTPAGAAPLTNKDRMQIDRVSMPEQDAEIRSGNFREVNLGLEMAIARLEAERCIQCPKPSCVDGCPVSVNIPRFLKFLREGDMPAAANSLLSDNALPCVTGRVCPQESQCEGVCIRGRKGNPVAIGWLERFVADWAQAHPDELIQVTPRPTGKKVAIVGSGPSGLTAAKELAKATPSLAGFVLLAPTEQADLGFTEQRAGVYQIDINYASARGPGSINRMADLLNATFKAGATFRRNGICAEVQSVSLGPLIVQNGWAKRPLSISFIAFTARI